MYYNATQRKVLNKALKGTYLTCKRASFEGQLMPLSKLKGHIFVLCYTKINYKQVVILYLNN